MRAGLPFPFLRSRLRQGHPQHAAGYCALFSGIQTWNCAPALAQNLTVFLHPVRPRCRILDVFRMGW
ncbi:hypothetical protein B4100_0317 [Heyndrickxia coagulans]|nr:hypothetical protein B4100_0317 [Heyndrickxia coagulans]